MCCGGGGAKARRLPGTPMSPEHHALEWSLPVIYDGLSEFYGALAPAFGAAHMAITRAHFSLWTALVYDDAAHLHLDEANLAAQAAALGIDRAACGAADRYVAGELLDLILRRFRRMPEAAQTNNAALLAILWHLQKASPRRQEPESAPKILARAA